MPVKKKVAKGKVKSSSSKKPTESIAVIALLLNVLILPGVGTIVGGRTNTGVIQIILFCLGILLSIVLIGIPLAIGIWIWGLVTGIQLLQEAK